MKTFGRLLTVAAHRSVHKHPNQPYQCRNTDIGLYDAAGRAAGTKNERDQIETEYPDQPPVQGTDKCQWLQNVTC